MRKLGLSQLEKQITEARLLEVEKLIDHKAVVALVQQEKNLWISQVDDGQKYEVEIFMVGQKTNKYTCDCTNEKPCLHIIASLFQIRKKKPTKKIAPRRKPVPPKTFDKLNMASLFHQIKGEDLIAFVRTYSSKDKKLQMALKTRFISEVHLNSIENKYAIFLNSLSRDAFDENWKPSASYFNNLKYVVREFFNHFDDAISLKNYAEALDILEAAFPKISFANNSFPEKTQFTQDDWKKIHAYFKTFIDHADVPELRNKLWSLGLELFTMKHYSYRELDLHMAQLLRKLSNEDEKIKTLLEAILAKLDSHIKLKSFPRDLSILIALAFNYAKTLKEQNIIQLWIEKCSDYFPSETGRYLKQYFELNNYKASTKLSNNFMQHKNVKSFVKNHVAEFQFKLAMDHFQEKEIIKFGTFLISQNFNLTLAIQLKNDHPKLWTKIFKNLTSDLSAISDKLAIELYLLNEQYDFAYKYLEIKNELEIIFEYDHRFPDSHEQKIFKLYADYLDNYIQSHLSPYTQTMCHNVLNHLSKNEMTKIRTQLIKHLEENHLDFDLFKIVTF